MKLSINFLENISKSHNFAHKLFIGGTLVGCVGIGAFAAYKAYNYYIKDYRCIDEGFEDTNKLEDNPIRKILVLGLENSGKSTIINKMVNAAHTTKPTEGFNVTPLEFDNTVFNFWEIGGKETVRKYWLNFLQDTDLLVYVVDASDIHNLPLAVKELKTVVGDERLKNVPVIVVAAKRYLPGALSEQEVGDAIDVRSIESYKHKVKVLGDDQPNKIDALKQAIIAMSRH